MKKFLSYAILFGSSVLAAACGSKSTPVTATQACADLAQAVCAKHSSCSGGTDIPRDYPDANTCLTREALSCTLAIAAPDNGRTPDSVENCVSAYTNYSCTDYLTNNPPAACITTGPRAIGAVCAFPGQCSSGYCSNKTANCGVCTTAPVAGDSCLNAACARQQQCVGHTNLCQPYPTAGQPCDNTTLPCGPDLTCYGNTNGNMGVCQAGITPFGATCGGTLGGCDGTIGLTCFQDSCVSVVYGANGATCGSVSGQAFSSCNDGGTCYASGALVAAGESGTCEAEAADNAACDIVAGPECMAPARCVVATGGTSGVCTLPSGATCG